VGVTYIPPLILLAPAPPDERLVLRRLPRPGRPDVDTPADIIAWWWLSPIVVEGPALLPTHIFAGMPRVLAEAALRDSVAMGRN
jgi:hypothetical protein